MASKKVAEQQASDLIPFDDDLLSAGTGLEDAEAGDYAIPFLRILQSMSPQLKKKLFKISLQVTRYYSKSLIFINLSIL